MTSPPIPDVLFLRPPSEDQTAVEVREPIERPGEPTPDVRFSSPTLSEVSIDPTVPIPHTRFQPRSTSAPIASPDPAKSESEASLAPAGGTSKPDTKSIVDLPARDRREPASRQNLESKTNAPENDQTKAPFPGSPSVGPSSTATPVSRTPLSARLPAYDPAVRPQVEPSWLVDRFQWNPISDRIMRHNPAALADFYRELRASISSTSSASRVLAIAGLGRHVGTTTLAQVAIRLLEKGQRQNPLPFQETSRPNLVIDASLWTPSLGSQIGLRCRKSWVDLQESRDRLGEGVIADSQNRIHVMPLNCVLQRDGLEDSTDEPVLASYSIPSSGLPGVLKRLRNVLNQARDVYANVIVDLGDLDLWLGRNALQPIRQLLTNLVIVHQPPIDRRTFSHVYWDLQALELSRIHVIENATFPE